MEGFTRKRVFIGNRYPIGPESFVYPWIEALAKSRVGLEEIMLKRMVVSTIKLNFVCLQGEVNVGALERQVDGFETWKGYIMGGLKGKQSHL
ncbi:unnamed protein product [Lathyrus sativus]|nr:unnamed protein product [Lathyrus sativus]